MTKQYDIMIIVTPDMDLSGKKSCEEVIQSLLKGHTQATVTSATLVGKKLFAYTIDKYSEGQYIMGSVLSSKLDTGLIQKNSKMLPNVIRFLVTEHEQPRKKTVWKKKKEIHDEHK
jgi:ribosomal protein S6